MLSNAKCNWSLQEFKDKGYLDDVLVKKSITNTRWVLCNLPKEYDYLPLVKDLGRYSSLGVSEEYILNYKEHTHTRRPLYMLNSYIQGLFDSLTTPYLGLLPLLHSESHKDFRELITKRLQLGY
jgi:hypothetical protein